MYLFFADDSRQKKPNLPGAGELIAIGGVAVHHTAVRQLNKKIDDLCLKAGIPSREEFKWSPGRELWMRKNLHGMARSQFFKDVLTAVGDEGGKAIVIIEDTDCSTASDATTSHEQDAVRLLVERFHSFVHQKGGHGLIVSDRPGGNRGDEEHFLRQCLEVLQEGTEWVVPNQLTATFSAPSRLHRLLQVADVITSCTLATVSGERNFAPLTFEHIKPMFDRNTTRIGGIGLKIHPDGRYANLYHWLVGDQHFCKFTQGLPLPLSGRPFAERPSWLT